jgi:hypothetical protein
MPRPAATHSGPSPRARRIALTILLATAVIDGLLLIAFVTALLVAPGSGIVELLGALYLFGWVYLVYLGLVGSRRDMWDWRFPALVAVTGGAIGALVGCLRMRREDAAPPPPRPGGGRKHPRAGGKPARPSGKRTAGPRAPASRRRSRGR